MKTNFILPKEHLQTTYKHPLSADLDCLFYLCIILMVYETLEIIWGHKFPWIVFSLLIPGVRMFHIMRVFGFKLFKFMHV